ncbi:MAG: TonB-dependent receptor [Chlorobi bacterium]|nr:TonB-dependent receptor [Chlorobiota bacterium]
MLKRISIVYLFAFLGFPVFAQYSISGKITDSHTGEPLPGANIIIENTLLATTSGTDGSYSFQKLKPGKYTLKVTFIGYSPVEKTANVNNDIQLDIQLVPTVYISDEVVISAIRAGGGNVTTSRQMDAGQIERNNTGQDLPYVMKTLPSTVISSDAGNGIGYTNIRIRGTGLTGINVTLNGVPVNDGESQGVYFVDLPDLASSVDNMKVQRGVGVSSNGEAAFGGSINIKTGEFNPDPYGEISVAGGSFNTFKGTLKFGSGLIRNKWLFDGRVSLIRSDGYVDRASSDLKSFYVSGGYYGNKDILKIIVMSGQEKTYQAWYGTPKDSLETNRTYNPAGMILDENGNITGYYDNQTDNYRQTYYQLHYAHEFSRRLNMAATLYYTKGIGYYESYKNNQKFSDYGWNDTVIGSDTITRTSLIRQKWLDNDFYGANVSLTYNPGRFELNIGTGGNQYFGKHYGYVVWSQVARLGDYDRPWYYNTGLKNNFHVFAKAAYHVTENFEIYLDLLYRYIHYDMKGTHDDLRDLTQTHNYSFFNPKLGLSYSINQQNSLFLYGGIANREPSRSVFRDADPGQKVLPERLYDLEIGYKYNASHFTAELNGFYMYYKDQLVQTGKINNVGTPIMTNVPRSYRTGVEFIGAARFLKIVNWQLNATYSRNKIQNFVSYVDNWDLWPQQVVDTLGTTDISFSPDFTLSGNLSVEPVSRLTISLISQYVGRQYIDNTSNLERSLDPYFVNDLRFFYSLPTGFFRQIDFWLTFNNIFNVKYEANAWVYRYVYDGTENEMNGYFPQATFNFMAGINLKF